MIDKQQVVDLWQECFNDSEAFVRLYFSTKYTEENTLVHIENGKVLSTAYKRPMGKKGYFKPHEYVYDEYYDCVICPEGGILEYRTTDRDGYREYKNSKAECRNCPVREKCTAGKSNVANKEYLKACTKNLNSIFETKKPIFIIPN